MLVDSLRNVIGTTFTLYFKAHTFHWNIEGPDFVQYHEFLGDFYKDVHSSVDVLAELIRTMNEYAPTSLNRMLELNGTSITETIIIPSALDMIKNIKNDNDVLLALLMIAYKDAEDEGELGISNYLQDRIQAHQKHAWMLRSITK